MWVVSHSTAVSQSSKRASRSPRTHASQPRRTISTFSCDIARPVSLQRLTVPSRTRPAAVGLLPHPGSFEGLVPIEVGLEAHDLPIAYLIYACMRRDRTPMPPLSLPRADSTPDTMTVSPGPSQISSGVKR